MATGFQFEDNSIETYQLGDDGREIVLGEKLTGVGEVRATNKYSFGTISGKGKRYSVQFHRLEEAHGSLTSNTANVDNASLIVLRITPKTDSPKRRFKNFTVTLTLESGNINSNADAPSMVAFEPASDGDEYFQEYITNVTKTTMYQGTLGVKPSMVDLSFSPSKSTARQSEDRRLLKLTATPFGETAGIDTEVKFEITPATEKNGIGDRLAVALIVKRAPGTSFFIKAVTSANVSYRLEDSLHWVPGKDHGSVLRLGPLGPQKTGVQTNPQGISVNDMMAAADKGLKKLAYLHLPEPGSKKLFVDSEVNGNATPEPAMTAPEPPATAVDRAIPEQTHDVATPMPTPTANAPILPSINVEDKAAEVAASQATPPRQHPSRPQRSALSVENSRAVRHRMMASLYHNLAQLHLEEAVETEGLIEMAYSDPAVTGGS